MELYHFLGAITFIYFFNIYYLFVFVFSCLMLRHYNKKYISSYKVKGTNKKLVNLWYYPINIYNKILSYEYDNFIFKFIFMCYDKVNKFYSVILDEVLIMFTDLFYDVVNDHLEKNTQNEHIQPPFLDMFSKNPELVNNMFNNFLEHVPKQQVQNINSDNKRILQDIKKFNNFLKPQNNSFLEPQNNNKILQDLKDINKMLEKNQTDINNRRIIDDDSDSDSCTEVSQRNINNKLIDDDSDSEEEIIVKKPISDDDQNGNFDEDIIIKTPLTDERLNDILDEEIQNIFKNDQDINNIKNNFDTIKNKLSNINSVQDL